MNSVTIYTYFTTSVTIPLSYRDTNLECFKDLLKNIY